RSISRHCAEKARNGTYRAHMIRSFPVRSPLVRLVWRPVQAEGVMKPTVSTDVGVEAVVAGRHADRQVRFTAGGVEVEPGVRHTRRHSGSTGRMSCTAAS